MIQRAMAVALTSSPGMAINCRPSGNPDARNTGSEKLGPPSKVHAAANCRLPVPSSPSGAGPDEANDTNAVPGVESA